MDCPYCGNYIDQTVAEWVSDFLLGTEDDEDYPDIKPVFIVCDDCEGVVTAKITVEKSDKSFASMNIYQKKLTDFNIKGASWQGKIFNNIERIRKLKGLIN